jgi:hypothetical protein
MKRLEHIGKYGDNMDEEWLKADDRSEAKLRAEPEPANPN